MLIRSRKEVLRILRISNELQFSLRLCSTIVHVEVLYLNSLVMQHFLFPRIRGNKTGVLYFYSNYKKLINDKVNVFHIIYEQGFASWAQTLCECL